MRRPAVNRSGLTAEACKSLRLTSHSPARGYVVQKFKTHSAMLPQLRTLEPAAVDTLRASTKRVAG